MTEGRLAPEEVRTRTFTRVVRGYRRREVRRLLERAAADLARLRNGPVRNGPDDEPPLTPEQVEEVRFQPALGGYEMDEVDEFLDQLVVELERAGRGPLRPPSALPAPAREGVFPAATPAATPGPPPPEPRPSADDEQPVAGPEGPPARPEGPAPRREAPAARHGPPAGPPEPTPTPLPPTPTPLPTPTPAAGPLPAAQPPPAAAPPAAGVP
ncbi:MAG TPA: DivIVA domain-containing protein, partial [Actinomycetota bacterium]|nr:DivIVA domain-containing protein [Actinomycetota bacterium]